MYFPRPFDRALRRPLNETPKEPEPVTDKPEPPPPRVPETGPVYGVLLAHRVQISGGLWQAMPNEAELKQAVEDGNERLVAAFEVLLNATRQGAEFIVDMNDNLDVEDMITSYDEAHVDIWRQFEATFPHLES